jgi:hypothetical protein
MGSSQWVHDQWIINPDSDRDWCKNHAGGSTKAGMNSTTAGIYSMYSICPGIQDISLKFISNYVI